MKTYQILLIIGLWSCQSNETTYVANYARDMWIQKYLITDGALNDLKSDSISPDANMVITYIDSILYGLHGFDIEKDYSYSDLDKLDSLLDYKTNTALFYGSEYMNPKKDDYSFLNLKIKVETYLNIKENKQLGEILFQQFKQGKLQHYREWTWEAKTFYNIPLIQLIIELKKIKIKIYQLEAIKKRL